MKKSILLLLCLVSMVSCSKKEDLFDKAKVEEESKENFPTQDIDPDHDWNMTAVGTLKVSINQGSGEVYTVKVYTGNPLNEQSDAKLMAKQDQVKDGTTLSLTFDMPKATTYVYVLLEDKIYNRSMKRVDMTQDTPSVSWKSSTQEGRSVYSKSRSENGFTYTRPDDSLFPTEIPAGVIDYPQNDNDCVENGIYHIKDRIVSLPWKKGMKLYVEGSVSIGSIPDGTQIYLLPDGKLNNSVSLPTGGVLSVGEGATVDISSVGGTGSIYNKGTIKANSVSSWEIFYVYNSGIFNVDNKINLTNSSSIVNLGTLSAKDINLDSSSFIINEAGAVLNVETCSEVTNHSILVNRGTWNVSSDMRFTSEGRIENEDGAVFNVGGTVTFTNLTAHLLNNGSFTAKKIDAKDGGCTIENKCKLFVKTEVSLGGSSVALDGGAYLECSTIMMYKTKILMGAKSLINVMGTGITYSNNNTIEGIGGALLYVKGSIRTENGGGQFVDYKGNLQLAYGSHFEEDYSYHYTIEESVDNLDLENIKIGDMNGCSRDYSTDNGGTPPSTDTPQVYTYAFEDITTAAGDYDFNDVVLKVSTIPVNGKMEIKLVAAGATKDLKVFYNDTPLFSGQEVHAAMGCESGQMINTGGVTGNVVTDNSIDWPGDGKLGDANFKILDVKSNMYVYLPKYSETSIPYGIVIPKDWDYPNERQRVDSKYPNFTTWAENMTQELTWYD